MVHHMYDLDKDSQKYGVICMQGVIFKMYKVKLNSQYIPFQTFQQNTIALVFNVLAFRHL